MRIYLIGSVGPIITQLDSKNWRFINPKILENKFEKLCI